MNVSPAKLGGADQFGGERTVRGRMKWASAYEAPERSLVANLLDEPWLCFRPINKEADHVCCVSIRVDQPDLKGDAIRGLYKLTPADSRLR